jgi:hypothetical protein
MRPQRFLCVLLLCAPLLATDIEGVQAVSMDQPRVCVALRRTRGGAPLAGKGQADLSAFLGDKNGSDKVTTFAAYLDTGASSICISTQTAATLGVRKVAVDDTPKGVVVFHDVGVGGKDSFNISEELYVSMGPYQALGAPAAEGGFAPAGGPWQCQIGPLEGSGVLSALIGPVDVVGMPAMASKVVVMDVRPVNAMTDVMKVAVLAPGSRDIPQTNRHVRLTYADFAAFTYTEPRGIKKPTMTANPFIGPDPLGNTDKSAHPIILHHNNASSNGSWLLDTGAAASMISKAQAARLGIRYRVGPDGNDTSTLEGPPRDRQFTLTIGGIGGAKDATGFFVDELRVPTSDGDDLVYKHAPVLVADITLQHPTTGQRVTLDGVFGMNMLVASAQVTGGLVPDIGKMAEGPYTFIVIDHDKGILGLQLRQ